MLKISLMSNPLKETESLFERVSLLFGGRMDECSNPQFKCHR